MAENANAGSGGVPERRQGRAERVGARPALRRRRPDGLRRRGQRFYRRHIRDRRGRYHSGPLGRLVARGELQALPRRVSRRWHLPLFVELYDVRFFRMWRRYLGQLALAILAIMAVLLLVDSVAEAILAAGLGSSVVIVFMHPTSRSASLRHLVGGHFLGLVVGVMGSLLLFHSTLLPVPDDLSHWAADVVGAGTMGFVMMLMAITDTEHPPAAATALGFSLQNLDWVQVGLFAGAVLLLAVAKALTRRQLQDLID